MKRTGGQIRNWRIIGGQVYGDVYGDERFRPGESVVTSLIRKITVDTMNTVYELDPETPADISTKRYVGKSA